MTYEQKQNFIRLSNDVNGNPRYYIGCYELAGLVRATTAEVEAVAYKAGFRISLMDYDVVDPYKDVFTIKAKEN
nr:MAG TPA: hypothetical protein [Caudoviricetes sp.]